MQNILGEAQANFNHEKIAWCNDYMKTMREIVLNKYDAISAHTLEYIENHIKIPPEEIEKQKNTGGRKNESNIRQEFYLIHATHDLRLGIYGNV